MKRARKVSNFHGEEHFKQKQKIRPILDTVLKQGVLILFQHDSARLGKPLF